ncbi:MAG: hypothetical protein OJI74_06660 [Rhodanobacter thiooxydans]|nr:hypothetical protein [Rhodanobacter thiooxydans]
MIEKLKAAYQKQGLTLPPEREEQMLQRMRQMQVNAIDAQVLSQSDPNAMPAQRAATAMGALRQGGVVPSTSSSPSVAAPVTGPAAASAASGMTSEQLLAAIAARHAQGMPTVFQQRPDGFIADGKPVIDPLGRVVVFGGDSGTGDVSYFVQTGPNQMLVRFANVHSSLPPVTVGTLTVNAAAQEFTSVDGKQVGGDTVIPAGRVVVVARDSAVFSYTYGKEVTTEPLPPHYVLSPYQRGDVAGTGYVLLRRVIDQAEKQNLVKNVGDLFKIVRGKEYGNDYALFSVHTGHVVQLAMNEDDEGGGVFSSDGRANFLHPYWRVTWMPTVDGSTAVVLEDGVKSVDVIRLDTDQRATVFHRAMGVESFNVVPLPNGSIKVTGAWGFHGHEVPEVRALFTNTQAPQS